MGAIQRAPSVGSPFQQALHKEYIKLAIGERDEQDWVDAAEFAERSSMSARGLEVMPEEIAARDLPEGTVGELTSARERLMAALGAGGGASQPTSAAMAQAGFDCWMQEQEENIQPEDIAACKKMFEDGMAAFAAAPAPAPAAAPAPKQMAPDSYAIYFPFDSSVLDAKAGSVIGTIANQFRSTGASSIFVSGHTDTAGSAAYNQRLAEARTKAVADALAAAGVPSGAINQRSWGESRPAKDVGDETRHMENRRVEVELVK